MTVKISIHCCCPKQAIVVLVEMFHAILFPIFELGSVEIVAPLLRNRRLFGSGCDDWMLRYCGVGEVV